ncbi:hypothetical protein [Nesterenkonia pannonica]|uniref:hypothetical protein n=1 Tax=Nesterenkonia pannonica TaxID=1548602 RepID=UPI0021645E4B|nr:hypothetical protein [Nesterenkonia pannonica]
MSAPLSRSAWLGAHVAVLLTGLLLILALVGVAMGISAFASLEEDGGRHFGQILVGSLAQAPAVLAVIGIVIALFGWAPRFAVPAGWVVVGFAGFMSTFGGLLELPEFVESLNLFGHLAEYPVEEIAWPPVLWLTGIGAAGIAVGFLGWNRREISRA